MLSFCAVRLRVLSNITGVARLSVPCTSRNSLESDINIVRARLLYQSKKRGILENDILLGDFAEEYLPKMSRTELEAYDKMINGEHMEWDLYYYLSGKKPAPSEMQSCPAFRIVKEFVDKKRQV